MADTDRASDLCSENDWNHVSIGTGCGASCRAAQRTDQPARGGDATFCRSAMACFKFLDRSLLPCRSVSCFFWSRRRMM